MITQKDEPLRSPIELVFISLTNSMGGAENVLHMLAKLDYSKVIFLKQRFSSVLPASSFQATYLTRRSLFIGFLKLLFEVYRFRKGYIFFSTHPYLNAYLGFLKRLGFIRSAVIVRECSSVFNRYSGLKRFSYKLAYRLGYPSVNLVICQTELMRAELLYSNSFIAENKVIVRENPLDFEGIQLRSQERLRDDLNGSYICAAGRLIPIKGFDILIQAFSKISLNNRDIKLVILGDGPEKVRLSRLIKDLDLDGHVILAGYVDNPVPYFKNAKVCVVSSIKEGFPNVLLEMMAVNRSVVSTLCAGEIENIASIVKVKPNDAEGLAIAIRSALIEDFKSFPGNSSDFLKGRTPDVFLKAVLHELDFRQNI